jgi:PPK2 family polyphosphate:nucleotide phosphotransferase
VRGDADVKLGRYRATTHGRFRLEDHDPAYIDRVQSKQAAHTALQESVSRLRALQEKLYAQDRWALLIVLQAMDAAGKDSTIEHVMSGVNPQGCEVHSFKGPSEEELDHDFLWRTTLRLPRRGHIGIFNRSYYEEVLVVRVHPELLERQKLPAPLLSKRIWADRFEDIKAYERYLTRNGIVVRKVFLHVSQEEQRKRFLERLQRPEKQWKFSMRDVEERTRWKDYMRAYEDMIRHTSTRDAPWFVVPADHKWFTRLVVSRIVIDALEGLDLRFPATDPASRRELARVRRALENER